MVGDDDGKGMVGDDDGKGMGTTRSSIRNSSDTTMPDLGSGGRGSSNDDDECSATSMTGSVLPDPESW